jgi:hypothetical protein
MATSVQLNSEIQELARAYLASICGSVHKPMRVYMRFWCFEVVSRLQQVRFLFAILATTS